VHDPRTGWEKRSGGWEEEEVEEIDMDGDGEGMSERGREGGLKNNRDRTLL
jgi:hypothetical protein